MSWSTITTTPATEVLQEFTPDELSLLNTISGATTNLSSILVRVVAEARGAIRAGGYELGSAGTLPDQVRNQVIDLARWRWLVAFPQLKPLQTDARKAAAEKAEELFRLISTQKVNIESPTAAAAAASWNSENKIVGRAHPVPRPGVQQTPQGNRYSNPNGPDDQGLDT